MSQRSNQVAEELRKIISQILIEDVSDPHLGFVTITRVEVTDDLRFARVFYSVLGDEEKKQESARAIAENLGYIKHLAVERINMKYATELRFELDRSIDHSLRIEGILRKIHEKDAGPEPRKDA